MKIEDLVASLRDREELLLLVARELALALAEALDRDEEEEVA